MNQCNREPPLISKSYAGALFCMSFFIPWYRLCPVFCCLFWFFLRFERWRKRSHLLYFWVVIEKCVFISVYFPNSEVETKICKKDKTLSNNFVMLETKIIFCFRNGIKWNKYQYRIQYLWFLNLISTEPDPIESFCFLVFNSESINPMVFW